MGLFELRSLSFGDMQGSDLFGELVCIIEDINVDDSRCTYPKLSIQRCYARDRLLIVCADKVNICVRVYLAKDRFVEASIRVRFYHNSGGRK
ncbi:hypothetical protein WJ23_27745 [Burkholderia lata]|nr:hypothetical protein WJ23_27745 [Burkholderia lata]